MRSEDFVSLKTKLFDHHGFALCYDFDYPLRLSS